MPIQTHDRRGRSVQRNVRKLRGLPVASTCKTTGMSIELVPLGTMIVTLGENIRMPGTPSGERVIVEFPAITWEGDRLRGTLKGKGSAADWLVIAADGTALIDISFTLETHDGALIFVQMNGRTNAATFS